LTKGAPLQKVFSSLPSISIDYGVAEPLSKEQNQIGVVPSEFDWSDVGSWETAWELANKDEAGNAMPDGSIAIDATDNHVSVPAHKTVALVGVSDLVIVDTGDALLIIPRHRCQDVRAVVDTLKKTGRTELL
jgi:mannose-1-phosphate guanylyltransferase